MTQGTEALPAALQAHLDTGATCLCRAWLIDRKDGEQFAFTDHDAPLELDGVSFKPDSGLSALTLEKTTGLAVDNTEAIGAISDISLRDEDINAGRFDGADVTAWLVNWIDPAQRVVQFRGNIGEISRAGGGFRAELRGVSDALNRPIGRVYQKPCGSFTGSETCGVNLDTPEFSVEAPVIEIENSRVFRFVGLTEFAANWFGRGFFVIRSGDAEGLRAAIKVDRIHDGLREISLWEPLRVTVSPGDSIQLYAGCDKRFETCRTKFDNAINFKGFPDIPEEEWIMVHATKAPSLAGGSRR